MATAVIMPRQGQSVESCILTQWYKEVGDRVSGGDLLFAYETDKAAFEAESPVDGILLARFFEEGDEVPVLENTAVVGEEGESFKEFMPGDSGSAGVRERPAEGPAGQAAHEQAGESATEPPGLTEPGHPGTTEPGQVGEAEPARAGQAGPRQAGKSGPEQAGGAENGRIRISPRASRLARERRVSIQSVSGSGPGGRIIERDILEEIRRGKRMTPLAQKKLEKEGLAVPGGGRTSQSRITSRDLVEAGAAREQTAQAAGGGDYTDVPLSNFRKLVSEAMFRSLQNSAQLTHHLGANASKMLRVRKLVKKKMGEGFVYDITLNDMVCYAVIRALKQHPDANAHFMGDRIRKFNQVNLGIAVDTKRGLMVPVLLNAGDYSLTGLSSQLKILAEDARKGSISPDLLSPAAASFTVSNLGSYGVEMFTPVINLPQVAILGVNTIIQRPTVLEDGSFGFQPFIGLSLTYDHRALDGGPATLFLAAIKNEIEHLSEELVL
jgi:pyruvate dehydrogenase E2 component (dihydrolipoamide acetyltransferase)